MSDKASQKPMAGFANEAASLLSKGSRAAERVSIARGPFAQEAPKSSRLAAGLLVDIQQSGDASYIVVGLANRLKLALQRVVTRDDVRQCIAELKQLPTENFQCGLNHLDVELLAAQLLPLLQQGSFLHQRIQLQVSLLCFEFISAPSEILSDLFDLRTEGAPAIASGRLCRPHSGR